MKKLALALLLAALPVVAHAGKVAVILEPNSKTNGSTLGAPAIVAVDLLRRAGVEHDIYNAGERTWGSAAVADSTWFRQNYEAVVIPYLEGGVSLLGTWGTNFKNAGGGSNGINWSPLSGHWDMPVYVMAFTTTAFASGATDETANAWVPGTRTSGGTGGVPAVASRGTWGFKLLARVNGSNTDTLYTNNPRRACLYGSGGWPGNGSVAAIAWYDSTTTGTSCTAGDTVATMWRFQPDSDKPGIVYSMMRATRWGSIDGILWCLQNLYATCDVSATPIKIVVEPHNAYAGDTTSAASIAHVAAIFDTAAAHGITMTLALPQVAQSDFIGPHSVDTRAELRKRITAGSRWQASSNATSPYASYTSADTANVREAYNARVNTAANSDSFALPIRMDDRFVPGGGIAGAWTSKVFADAGIKTIVSTLSTQQTNWAMLVGSSQADKPARLPVPGESNGRAVYVVGTIGWSDGADMPTITGGQSVSDYLGQEVTQRIGWAAQTHKSLYWHMSTNADGTDGYWRWFMSVIGRHFDYFDKVITTGQMSD